MTTQPKIQIIDDDPASLALLKAALTQDHYEDVSAFLNSTLAQKSYSENKYDVIITDLRMPGLSGFDLLSQIGEANKVNDHNPIVIILTAQAETDIAKRALSMGAKKVFFKPYKVSELLQELAKLLAESQLQGT